MNTLHVVPLLLLAFAAATALSEDADTIQARWQPRQIQATFSGLRTAYNCDAVEHRIQRLITTLGAHRKTTVLVTGCAINRIASTFFIHITTATSVPTHETGISDAKEE